jgi:hypothetical protein
VSSYDETWRRVSEAAAEAAVRTAWEQWAAIGSLARSAADAAVRRVVDPEALVLTSLGFEDRERRLRDLVRWWARVGAPLTSVQRMRTLVADFGAESPRRLALFSRWASDAGHRSWAPHASGASTDDPGNGSRGWKGPSELTLLEPATLMLRMRAAFGVGAKSDVLTYLIGLQGSKATVSSISAAVGYTETAVRGALKDMALARLIREAGARPAYYRTSHRPWVDLLELDAPGPTDERSGPRWGMWPRLFGLLIDAHELGLRVATTGESEYVVASAARDALERAIPALDVHGIDVPDLDRHPGRSFVDAMLEVVRAVSAWMEANR